MNLGGVNGEWREDVQLDLALRCRLALVPREPRALKGTTSQIGPRKVAIRLDSDLPMSEWPRVGDVVSAECEIPADHKSKFKILRCSGRIAQVLVAQDGSLRLEINVVKMRFAA